MAKLRDCEPNVLPLPTIDGGSNDPDRQLSIFFGLVLPSTVSAIGLTNGPPKKRNSRLVLGHPVKHYEEPLVRMPHRPLPHAPHVEPLIFLVGQVQLAVLLRS